MADSIFTKIINREIPATIRFEDDDFIAIDDIHPKAPTHILVIPKKPWHTLEEVDLSNDQFHAQLLSTVRQVAKLAGIDKNYKIFMNVGLGVQAIDHLHVHLLGGWQKATVDTTANGL